MQTDDDHTSKARGLAFRKRIFNKKGELNASLALQLYTFLTDEEWKKFRAELEELEEIGRIRGRFA